MIKTAITVEDPADILQGYGAGALIRLERSATSDFATTTEVTTIPVVAATYGYEYWDASGTAASWYRVRYSTATPAVAGDYSAYGAPFQVGGTGYTDTDDVKAFYRFSDGLDDGLLGDIVADVNAWITDEIGVALYPSGDTVRLYDGARAVRRGTRLYIPGGIRTLTGIRLADSTGGTLTAGTVADFLLRPKSFERRPGQPAQWIDVSDTPAGSYSAFPPYRDNVELTGTFDYAEAPRSLRSLARKLSIRMYNARGTELPAPNPSVFMSADDDATLARYRAEAISVAG